MGRNRYQFSQPDQPHFMTITVLHWIAVFTWPGNEVMLTGLSIEDTQAQEIILVVMDY